MRALRHVAVFVRGTARPGAGARVTLVSVAAALLLATVTTSATAATTYTVSGGPTTNFVASVQPSGTTTPSPGLHLQLIEPNQFISCTGFSLGGSVVSPGVSRAYGADAAGLGTLIANGCTNPVMGATTFTALTTPALTIIGDATGGRWPARVKNVQWKVRWVNCTFYLSGVINGSLDPATQVFTPAGNPRTSPAADGVPVGLTISDTPAPPTGSMCVTFDLQVGDSVAITGTFANTPPSGSTTLAVANP